MNRLIDITDLLSDTRHCQIIDVRSPSEFHNGHIPGAINIPLFSDEERARVGTLYKQVSPEAAMQEGLKIAGSKMDEYAKLAKPYLKENLVIHCWRGGKRSEAMQWLINFTGGSASRLRGGYKNYRQAIHSFFETTNFEFRILGGCTGAGKTEILHELSKRDHQVIDLEKIAHHKGSAFGSIGEPSQPTNEQFENDLFSVMSILDPEKPVWIENESRNIGKVYLPEPVWLQMRASTLFNIQVDRDVRLERAIKYYNVDENLEALLLAFQKIRKRLGGLEYQHAIEALNNNDLKTAASIALKYYDKMYNFQLQAWSPEKVVNLPPCNTVEEATTELESITINS